MSQLHNTCRNYTLRTILVSLYKYFKSTNLLYAITWRVLAFTKWWHICKFGRFCRIMSFVITHKRIFCKQLLINCKLRIFFVKKVRVLVSVVNLKYISLYLVYILQREVIFIFVNPTKSLYIKCHFGNVFNARLLICRMYFLKLNGNTLKWSYSSKTL